MLSLVIALTITILPQLGLKDDMSSTFFSYYGFYSGNITSDLHPLNYLLQAC